MFSHGLCSGLEKEWQHWLLSMSWCATTTHSMILVVFFDFNFHNSLLKLCFFSIFIRER